MHSHPVTQMINMGNKPRPVEDLGEAVGPRAETRRNHCIHHAPREHQSSTREKQTYAVFYRVLEKLDSCITSQHLAGIHGREGQLIGIHLKGTVPSKMYHEKNTF